MHTCMFSTNFVRETCELLACHYIFTVAILQAHNKNLGFYFYGPALDQVQVALGSPDSNYVAVGCIGTKGQVKGQGQFQLYVVNGFMAEGLYT